MVEIKPNHRIVSECTCNSEGSGGDNGFGVGDLRSQAKYGPLTGSKNCCSSGGLENIVQNVAKTKNPTLQQLRKVAGNILGGRVKQCGSYLVPDREMVDVVENDKGVHFSGLVTCGNVWTCPVCQYKIMARKRAQLGRILTNSIGDGCKLGYITLTVPHHAFQSAKELQSVVVESYRKIRQSRRYRRIIGKIKDESFGEDVQLRLDVVGRTGRKKQLPKVLLPEFVGDIRTLEVTHGANGWHPHLHVLLVAKCSEEQMEIFASEIFDMWSKQVEKQKLGKCSPQAFKYKLIEDDEGIGDYVGKSDIVWEMADSHGKSAKGSGRNPSQILFDIWAGNGDPERDKKLYKEYAEAFRGRAKLTINGELKDRYLVIDQDLVDASEDYQERLEKLKEELQLIEDKTDEEIANERQEGVVIGEIHREIWREIRQRHLSEVLKDHFYSGGVLEAFEVLRGQGIACILSGIAILPDIPPPKIGPEIILPSKANSN